MPDEIRINRPPLVRPDSGMPSSGYEMQSPRPRSKAPWIILVLVVVIIVVLGFVFRDKLFNKTSNGSSGYQAVFLTNGQVYFGKLSHANGEYATLKDIYYLQVVTPANTPLQGQGSQAQAAQQQLQLVKLGQELHGPLDSMQINRSQVLFYEDMKEDGKVMQAIRENQKNPQGTQSQTTPPASTQQVPATTPVK